MNELVDALGGWLVINLLLLFIGLIFGPFVFIRDEQIGQGQGIDRLRNSSGELPFQGIRLALSIALFVALPAAAGMQDGGISGLIAGAILGGAFFVWLALLGWVSNV